MLSISLDLLINAEEDSCTRVLLSILWRVTLLLIITFVLKCEDQLLLWHKRYMLQ